MRRTRHIHRIRMTHVLSTGVIVSLPLMIAGCKNQGAPVAPAALTEHVPTPQQIVAAHNERVAKLGATYSDGVIELRWSDERGKHFEQGDLELWQTSDNRTALQISKLGERLLWMGSSGEQWWLFDLMNKDERVLIVGTHEDLGDRFGAIGVKPLGLLDLLGLSPIDCVTDANQPVTANNDLHAFMLDAKGRGGRLRIAFDQSTLLPKRIELLDATGAVAAASTLSRYASVDVPGMAIMALPKLPLTIDIHREQAVGSSMAGDAKIALNETVGEIKEKAASQIFDLDRLTAAMRPDRVERLEQVASP